MMSQEHGHVSAFTGPLWGESTSGFLSQKASNAELWFLLAFRQAFKQTCVLSVFFIAHVTSILFLYFQDKEKFADLDRALRDNDKSEQADVITEKHKENVELTADCFR